MTELSWPPDVFGRLTPRQVIALLADRDPGEPEPITTAEGLQAYNARRAAERAAWEGR
jgi:hypothetical protein